MSIWEVNQVSIDTGKYNWVKVGKACKHILINSTHFDKYQVFYEKHEKKFTVRALMLLYKRYFWFT